ncbi:hypothetical protein [Dysgonomonas macrotermitis]|uniref:Uncharacterized protein n=1 Tax=Dysgonomonas macrotermitis TaxID=1346286 RepID=A0A1M4ZK46_9BACT|nr:hypothetical protein [Dysgonomonas macrotermitis]SHF18419.1 hypothetical protein SAMN05444362_104113 [Dysgonomonas macrotermitis]
MRKIYCQKINTIYLGVFCALILFANPSNAQVVKINGVTSGIRMQIDPLNNSSGTTGVTDDLVITSDGNLGFGTTAPSVKVEVRGGLRIVDGQQQEGAFFVSDATGLGSWRDADMVGRRIALGNIMTTQNLATTYTNVTSTPLNLKGGLWMIVGRVDVVGTATGTEDRAQFVWIKIEEKTTDTQGTVTTKTISESGLPHMIRTGVYSQYYCTPMVTGFVSIPLEGISQKKREYSIYVKSPSPSYTSPRLTSNLSGAYFYAIKLQ